MDILKNITGFLTLYLPYFAVIAMIIVLVLMIKKKVKKAVIGAFIIAAAAVGAFYTGAPYTEGPHTKYVWKHIGETNALSEEEINDAMEACKEYFCGRDGFKYCWLQELSFNENEYTYQKNSDSKEKLIIDSRIKSGFKASAAYSGWYFTVERGQGENWTVKSVGGG